MNTTTTGTTPPKTTPSPTPSPTASPTPSPTQHGAHALASYEALAHPAGPSWQSRCINALLAMLPIKQRTASAAAVQDYARKMARRPASHRPSGLGRDIKVSLTIEHGWPIYEARPATGPAPGHDVLFFHGGGYVKELVPAHWRFIAYLIREAGVRCIVPAYPLAPRGTAKEVVPVAGALLGKLIDEAGPRKVTVVGNSAGAGLGLAAAQRLRDRGHRQPDGLVLVSPGLDASLRRARELGLAASDPIQDLPGIREAARLYAGDLDIGHRYVSPLNGEMDGLAPMTVFAGTRDLLYPDSVELALKARAAGVPVELHLRRGQPHNYAGLPTPEGREAREAILRVLAR